MSVMSEIEIGRMLCRTVLANKTKELSDLMIIAKAILKVDHANEQKMWCEAMSRAFVCKNIARFGSDILSMIDNLKSSDSLVAFEYETFYVNLKNRLHHKYDNMNSAVNTLIPSEEQFSNNMDDMLPQHVWDMSLELVAMFKKFLMTLRILQPVVIESSLIGELKEVINEINSIFLLWKVPSSVSKNTVCTADITNSSQCMPSDVGQEKPISKSTVSASDIRNYFQNAPSDVHKKKLLITSDTMSSESQPPLCSYSEPISQQNTSSKPFVVDREKLQLPVVAKKINRQINEAEAKLGIKKECGKNKSVATAESKEKVYDSSFVNDTNDYFVCKECNSEFKIVLNDYKISYGIHMEGEEHKQKLLLKAEKKSTTSTKVHNNKKLPQLPIDSKVQDCLNFTNGENKLENSNKDSSSDTNLDEAPKETSDNFYCHQCKVKFINYRNNYNLSYYIHERTAEHGETLERISAFCSGNVKSNSDELLCEYEKEPNPTNVLKSVAASNENYGPENEENIVNEEKDRKGYSMDWSIFFGMGPEHGAYIRKTEQEYRCELCDVEVNSVAGMKKHLDSKTHFTLHQQVMAATSTETDSTNKQLDPKTSPENSKEVATTVVSAIQSSESKLQIVDTSFGPRFDKCDIEDVIGNHTIFIEFRNDRLHCVLCNCTMENISQLKQHVEGVCHTSNFQKIDHFPNQTKNKGVSQQGKQNSCEQYDDRAFRNALGGHDEFIKALGHSHKGIDEFNCFLCNVTVFGTFEVFEHIAGDKHLTLYRQINS